MLVAPLRGCEQLGRRVACLPGKVRTSAEDLQAAVLPALVERPVGIDDHVANLARRPVAAAMQLSIDDQTATDPGRPRDVNHVPGAAAGSAVVLT